MAGIKKADKENRLQHTAMWNSENYKTVQEIRQKEHRQWGTKKLRQRTPRNRSIKHGMKERKKKDFLSPRNRTHNGMND